MADDPKNFKPLDDLLPVRRIYELVGGVLRRLRFAVDFVFDGDEFDLTEDSTNRRLTVSLKNKGVVPDDAASFGSEFPVLSRVLRLHTTDATPTEFTDPEGVAGIDAFQVNAGEAADLVGTLLGKKRASGDRYRADVRGTIGNNLPVSATLALDAVTNAGGTGSLTTASVAITTDGAGAFVVTVTGVAATDIDWTFAFQVQPTGVIT